MPALKTGETYLFATASVLRDSIGNIVGAVESIRDITERKLMEEKVREQVGFLETLFDTIPNPIFYKDANGLYTGCNQAFLEHTGKPMEDILGKTVYDIAPRDIADKYAEKDRELFEHRGNQQYDWQVQYRQGEVRQVIFNKATLVDAHGAVRGLIGVISDITERKHAEEALRETEARLKMAMDLAKLVKWEYDVKTGMFSFDDQFYALYGTTSQHEGGPQMTAETYARKFIPPEESHLVAEGIAKTLATTDPNFTDQVEHRIIRADGEERHIIAHWGVVCDQTGRVVKTRGSNQDITERKRLEEELRENQSRLELALRSAHMGVWHWDLIKNKRFFDDQVCRLLGIDQAKFTGTAVEFFNAVHPDDREALKAALARTIGQDVPYETEYRSVWPDGSVHYIVARAKLFRDKTGQPVRVNGLAWEVTERKRMEEEKEKIETQLRQSQKLEAIGTLAGGIAHDFNNILQPMIGYTEMALLELSLSSPLRNDLEQVLNASLRAKELIRQILAISRATQEQQRIPTDISPIIKEALKLLRSSLPASIEMRQKIRKGVALADPTQIHQVLMNLCTNAAHAMDEKGILEVRLSTVDLSESDLADRSIVDLKPGPHLKLCVSDTGAGMDAKTMERIFDPYFTTKEVGKGSGLGLAVVNGIVKRHEGAVTVRSEPGRGTTFTIYIPMMETADAIPIETPTYEALIGTESILLLDDEQAVVEMGTAILEGLGYKLTAGTDSLRALEVFSARADEFDLIITDYTMPNMTGMDLAKEVRRIRPDIPILICTGFSEKITPESARELGIELLMKPYSIRQISRAVRKILDARKGG
jgi:PAS domain S-box-containing protein